MNNNFNEKQQKLVRPKPDQPDRLLRPWPE